MKISERVFLPLAFALGFIVGGLILWGALGRWPQPQIQAPEQPLTVQPDGKGLPQTVPTSTEEGMTDEEASSTVAPESLTSFAMAPEISHGPIDVTWLNKPVKLSTTEAKNVIMTFTTDTGMFDRMTIDYSSGQYDPNGPQDAFDSMWKLGGVTTPEYPGGTIYLLNTNVPEPGGTYKDVIMVSPQMKQAWFLYKYTPVYAPSPFAFAHTTPAPNLVISGINEPEKITLESGKVLKRDDSVIGIFNQAPYFRFEMTPEELASLKVAATVNGQTLYTRTNANADLGCILMVLPDWQIIRYDSRIPGVAFDDRTIQPDVTWDPGYENASRYNDHAIGGCGAAGCMDVVDPSEVGDVSVVGKTSDGDPVYVPAKPLSSPLVKRAYDTWYVAEGEKPTIDAFVKKYPAGIVLWKDALGRWVRLTHSDVMPMAECGKPVIYLYPEQTEAVHVALPSFVNVTKSEPTYPTNGWTVSAHPNGTLDLNGSSYDSLYWEGTGVGYDTPKSGFVIKEGEVDASLRSILAQYGLNEKESQDFRDFWVPKMTGAKYYRVSFLTSDWSKAAPLSVSPRPQTSIRIFMDWQKLDAPIPLPAPQIVTPVRNGFTVVEWGGLLR